MKNKAKKKGGVFVDEELERDKKTILVVDDEEPIRDILSHNLSKEGYRIIEAGDGMTNAQNVSPCAS